MRSSSLCLSPRPRPLLTPSTRAPWLSLQYRRSLNAIDATEDLIRPPPRHRRDVSFSDGVHGARQQDFQRHLVALRDQPRHAERVVEPELDVGLVRGRARAPRAVHLLLEVVPFAHPAPGRRRVARQVEAVDVPVRVGVRDAHRVRRLLGGQNYDAVARRLELADARADEGGNIALRRVLAERSLGQRCGRQALGSALVLAAREGSHPLSKR